MRIHPAIRGALCRARRVPAVSVYIHVGPDGRKGVNIHGGTAPEVAQVMTAALMFPHAPAPAAVPAAPAPAPTVPPPSSYEFGAPVFGEPPQFFDEPEF